MQAIDVTLGLLAFAPAVAYALWMRASETHEREPVRAVLGAVLFGATAGVALAVVAGLLLRWNLGQMGLGVPAGILVLVAAPVLEELAKAAGLPFLRREVNEVEDGIIYGTAIGVGFAATETVLYATQAMAADGVGLAFQTIAFRSVSALLLHGATAAIVGYAYARIRMHGRSRWTLVGALAVAMAIHAGYNLLVGFDPNIGWGANVLLVLGLSLALRIRLRQLDRESAPSPAPLYVVD